MSRMRTGPGNQGPNNPTGGGAQYGSGFEYHPLQLPADLSGKISSRW